MPWWVARWWWTMVTLAGATPLLGHRFAPSPLIHDISSTAKAVEGYES